MYCTIVEKECKKIPRGREYRKIQWRAYDWDPLQGIWHQEDEVPRDLKHKWDIVLNKSFRENGKVKKQQHHIGTISYWDIVGGWHSGSIDERIEGYFKLKIMEELGISREDVAAERKKSVTFKDQPLREKIKVKFDEFQHQENYGVEYKKIDTLIYSKFQPIIDQVMKEYRSSEEFTIETRNEALKKAKREEIDKEKEYLKKKSETDSYKGQGYYDAHYFKDGTFNSKGTREWERTHKEQEQKSNGNYSSTGSFNFDFMRSSPFSDSEKTMADELIILGYKKMAKVLHPDVGGTKEKFQSLLDIKDRLLSLIK